MLIIVVLLFGLCWFPLQLYNILHVTWEGVNDYKYINIVWFCCDWLAMSNSCYNPFIYGIYNVIRILLFENEWLYPLEWYIVDFIKNRKSSNVNFDDGFRFFVWEVAMQTIKIYPCIHVRAQYDLHTQQHRPKQSSPFNRMRPSDSIIRIIWTAQVDSILDFRWNCLQIFVLIILTIMQNTLSIIFKKCQVLEQRITLIIIGR